MAIHKNQKFTITEKAFRISLPTSSSFLIILLIGFFITLLIASMPSIKALGIKFIYSSAWDPVEDDYGALPFLVGTLLTSLLALILALPFSIAIGLFLGEYYTQGKISSLFKNVIELLAGIPSVIYGFWGLFILVPIIRSIEISLGYPPYGVGLLTASFILSIMIMPYAVSITRQVITMVPSNLKEAAYSLGATRFEVIRKVILPYTRSGIFAGILLALGRALGETMAVTMLIGNMHIIPKNIFAPANTMPSIIANEFNEATGSIYTSALIEMALLLFVVTTIINILLEKLSQDLHIMTTKKELNIRLIKNNFFKGIIILFTCVSILPLFFILYYIIRQGVNSISWSFLTSLPKPVGETGGGILNALEGSLIMIILASIIAIPFSVYIGIFLSEFPKNKLAYITRLSVDVLQGIPSIVIGIVIYVWIVKPMGSFSALSGSIALALMMIPSITKSTEETLKLIPGTLKEASLSLGVPYYKTIFKVILPAGISGILSGIILSISRVAGETAPLLFTAFGNPFMNANILKPMSSIPLLIFNYAISPYDDWHKLAWGASFVLIMFIFILNFITKLAVRKWKVQF